MDYLTRLARVLEQPLVLVDPAPLAPYPRLPAEALEPGDLSINMLEFFDLHRCDLGGLVGFRNSGLGRLQVPTERWLYELQLLDGVSRCPGFDRDLAAQLRARLPDTRLRALLVGEDWRAFVSVDQTLLDSSDVGVDGGGMERTLQTLSGLVSRGALTGAEVVDTRLRLNETLGSLRFGRALGRTRVAWSRQHRLHASALRMLTHAEPLCRSGQPTPRGRIARTVLLERYAARIQPPLAQLPGAGRGWLVSLSDFVAIVSRPIQKSCVQTDALQAETRAGTRALGADRTEDTRIRAPDTRQALERFSCVLSDWHAGIVAPKAASEVSQLSAVVTAHTREWQRLLRACGLEPGRR
ncbi:MAG: DUF3080 family protein [Pseudomonadota bacterium]